MEIIDLDAEGFAAARAHAEAIDWLPDDCSLADRQDGYRQPGEILLAYLNALPKPEQGRDRIAVSRFASGSGVSQFMRAGEHLDWALIESCIDYEEGAAARYIVRANCPPPAELVPVEVEGSVEPKP